MALDKQSLDALRIDPEDRASQRSGWLGPVVVAVVIALAVALFLALKPPGAQSPRVRVAAVLSPVSAQNAAVLNASGYVVARRIATVSSKVTGKIVEVLVEEGLDVGEGDVLARLDDSTVQVRLALGRSELASAKAALAETKVRLAEARRDEDRKAALRADRLISEAELDAAQSEVSALEARLATAASSVAVSQSSLAVIEQDLDDLVIRAPFAGVVISKNAQPGEMISPISSGGFTRTGICTIVDMDSREVEVDVNEAYINRVQPGQPVIARLDAYPDWEIPARVINIVPAADRQKATVRVRIAFDGLDRRILPDMGVKVRFLEEPTGPEAQPGPPVVALVPAEAVIDEAGTRYVWVLSGDTVERRALRLGGARGASVEVLAGVTPGEQVVIGDTAGLSDGGRVSRE